MRRLEVGSSKLPWGRAALKENGVGAEWDEYVHDLHQLRLKHVRADVKKHMKTPRSLLIHEAMNKGGKNAKREAMMEERYLEIERANRALLNRLSSVMRKPGDVVSMVQASQNSGAMRTTTLNKVFRNKQLKRIDAENEKLIHQIERGKSTYSRKAWAADRRQQEKYLKNISRYRNGPQATALRTAPRIARKSKKRSQGSKGGRLRVHRSKSQTGTGEFVGYHDWRRQKHHQRKKKWTKSLPPLEAGGHGGSSVMMGRSESSPAMSFVRPEMHAGQTRITETTLGGSAVAARSSRTGAPAVAVPNHTKVFEAGRQMNGVFAVVSAITRGSALVIQAFVPEDQTTTEVEVTPQQAKHAMRHVSSDIFRPERREDLCRALVAKVEFFFKDSKRMLLFNDQSTEGDTAATAGLMASQQQQQQQQRRRRQEEGGATSAALSAADAAVPAPGANAGPGSALLPAPGDAEPEDQEAQRDALEGVFRLIPAYEKEGEGLLRKSDWLDAASSSDRVKQVLRSEILCGYPPLRLLRKPEAYRNYLHTLVTRKDGFVDVDELLLFAQDLVQRGGSAASGGAVDSWRAAIRLFNRSERPSGRHVMVTLHDWSYLRIHDLFGPEKGVFESQLPPVVTDTVRRADRPEEKVDILREYILEEQLIPGLSM